MKKILIIGKVGQLGWELQRTLAPLGEIHSIDYPDIDLRDADAARRLVRSVAPEILVNATAYTDVDGAEKNPELSAQINAVAPGLLASELRETGGCLIVHYSTDYVFDGTASRPYREDDRVAPLNVYGQTKLEGERAVTESGLPCLVFRTQWLYGPRGKNFMLTILRLAREGKPLRIIADQFGSPTTARMLAEATAMSLVRIGDSDVTSFSGVYHATAAGQASWYEFTRAILEEYCASGDPPEWCRQAFASLQPISTQEYPLPARRPAYAVLSNEKLSRVFGIRMPHWRDQLRLCMQELR